MHFTDGYELKLDLNTVHTGNVLHKWIMCVTILHLYLQHSTVI